VLHLTRGRWACGTSRARLARQGQLARAKLEELHQTMKKLAPQIRYWLKTGFVAATRAGGSQDFAGEFPDRL